MKLCLAPLAVVIGTVLLTGCGPGLGHHGAYAKAADAVSTTSLTSEQLPGARMPVAKESGLKPMQWEEPWAEETSDAEPKLQTWGAAPKAEERYGF